MMAILTQSQKDELDRNELRQTAVRTFFWGSVLQWLAMSVNWALLLYLQFEFTLFDGWSRAVGMSFLGYLRVNNLPELFLGFSIGSLVYILTLRRLAVAAPNRLLERGNSLFQVAALLAILPSILGTFTGLASFLAVRGMLDRLFQGNQLAEIFLPASLFYFVPGVIVGMLAGLAVRQKGLAIAEQRRLEMREDWDLDIHQRT
jgi:hypothetical protein